MSNLQPSAPDAKEQLVLAPGMLCDAEVWTHQIAGLAGRADCLVPDYGDARSMTQMATRVLSQAPLLFSIAGHSMGGRVALEVCRLAPRRVRRLCLLSTEHRPAPAGEAGRRESEGRRALLELARTQGMGAVARSWLPHLVSPRRAGDEALTGVVLRMIERQTPALLDAQIAAGESRPDSAAVLSGLRIPLLIMGGEDDVIRPPVAQQAMAALARGADLHILSGCGHMITMERPGEVLAAFSRWLALSPPAVLDN